MNADNRPGRWDRFRSGASHDPAPPAPKSHWQRYYDAVAGHPPRETTLMALENWKAEFPDRDTGIAADLGSGAGRDTVAFLREGWRVIAIDSDARGLDILAERPDLPEQGTLDCICGTMEDTDLPDELDIINACFSLPFCPPRHFPSLWEKIVKSLHTGGRFAGQLLGPEDDWANPGLTVLPRDYVDALLSPFDVEHLEEVNRAGKDAMGNPKHWHLYHIVARKLPPGEMRPPVVKPPF